MATIHITSDRQTYITQFLCNYQVTGLIKDASGTVQYVLSGTWDTQLEGARVLKTSETSKGKVVYETGDASVLWQRRYPPSVHAYLYLYGV